jgi:4'-phosphopantetheinyl transferase
MKPCFSLPANITLAEGEIHLWETLFSRAADDDDFYLSGLSALEVERCRRFHSLTDRRRYAVSHSILRGLLGAYLNVPPQAINYDYNRFGKPFPANANDLNFNLSHSQDLLLIGFRRSAPIGVDAELVQRIDDLFKVASTVFNAEEMKVLTAAPKDLQTELFYSIWVRKEAFVKALGQGFSLPITESNIKLCIRNLTFDKGNKINLKPSLAGSWMSLEFGPEPGYLAAVVTPAAELTISLRSIPSG